MQRRTLDIGAGRREVTLELWLVGLLRLWRLLLLLLLLLEIVIDSSDGRFLRRSGCRRLLRLLRWRCCG